MDLYKDFIDFFPENSINKNARFLLAVSGGVDSVVLAGLFKRAEMDFSIAHCNFSLRGEESNLDDRWVADLAAKYQVRFLTKRFPTREYADEMQVSIQMAARDLRYEWFRELMEDEDFRYVASAHHRNDVIETILFNLVKGTGISGLRGILPVNDGIIRPLIGNTKEQILQYARDNQLEWREDSSNQEIKYHRNYLRKQVIPLLQKINPSFPDSMDDSLEKLRLVESIYEKTIRDKKVRVVKTRHDGHSIAKKDIEGDFSIPFLFEMIREFGFSYDQCRQILSGDGSGRSIESSGYLMVDDRDQWLITPRSAGPEPVLIDWQQDKAFWGGKNLLISVQKGGLECVTKDESIGFFDLDTLNFPLTLRSWQEGDYFYPLGMRGKKKISDFMIDRKIALNLKKGVGLLCSKGEVIWVVGHRIDDRFKVNSSTGNILKVQIVKGNV